MKISRYVLIGLCLAPTDFVHAMDLEKCPLGDLRRIPVEEAVKLKVPEDLARDALDGPGAFRLLSAVKSHQWLERPAGKKVLETLAARIYDPDFNRSILERADAMKKNIGASPDSTAPSAREMRRMILDEVMKETGVRMPEAVKKQWLEGLAQIPFYSRLGVSRSEDEHKARVREFLRRPIAGEVRRDMGKRIKLGPKTVFNRNQRRAIGKASAGGTTDTEVRTAAETMLSRFIRDEDYRSVNPGTPGDRTRLEEVLRTTGKNAGYGSGAYREYIVKFLSYVLLGEKPPKVTAAEISDYIRAPLISQARVVANEQRKLNEAAEREAERLARLNWSEKKSDSELPKRVVRPLSEAERNRPKPEPRVAPKEILPASEIESSSESTPAEPVTPLRYEEWTAQLESGALNPKEFQKFLVEMNQQPENVRGQITKRLEELARTGELDPAKYKSKKVVGAGIGSLYQIIMIGDHNTTRILFGYDEKDQVHVVSSRVSIKAGQSGQNRRQTNWIHQSHSTWLRWLEKQPRSE